MSFVTHLFCLPLLLARVASGYSQTDRSSFRPTRLAVGSELSLDGQGFERFTLKPSHPLATLDYGHEVAGYPFFEFESVEGSIQIEVKYAEEFSALKHDFSDGPLPFASSLANTFRVETFEISKAGRIQSSLIQGGQRWQSIKLLTKGSVTLKSLGYVPSISVMNVERLPGRFESSDAELNEIWKLGARSTILSCVDAGSQKSIWNVTEDNGAHVRGTRAGTTTFGATLRNYTLEFDTKIERGGVGWTVAFPLASPARGIQLNLAADEQTFVNTNTSIIRPNTVVFGYGYSLVNQTSLTSYYLDTFNVPFAIKTNTWYRIKTVLDGQHLAVSIGSTAIFNLTLSNYPINDQSLVNGVIDSQGSWGFGGWQDQAGYFKNVVVSDTANGTVLYRNPMTDAPAVVREYGVQANTQSVCMDGPKRDRLVWLGDFFHTVRVIAASTSRFDWAKGTLQYFVDWQSSDGLMPYAPPIGYTPELAKLAYSRGGGAIFQGQNVNGIILPDYQVLGVLSFSEYIRLANDLAFARKTWPNWRANLEWVLSNVNSTTGLLQLLSGFLGPGDGSAVNCALVEALKGMSDTATAIGESSDAARYSELADSLAMAINQLLWNGDLGVYGQSLADLSNFSVSSIAFCITSGTASPKQAAQLTSALSALELSPGFKDTSASSSSFETVISPNTNGYLLPAILSHNTPSGAVTAKKLMKSLWTPMFNNKATSSGASWEYLNQNGDPGLGIYSSLAHPWGGAPTYILTEWVTGIRTASGPPGFGYRNWVVAPQMGVYMGIKEAKSQVVTAFEGSLKVHWKVKGRKLDVSIRAPRMTSGIFQLGDVKRVLSGRDSYHFSVKF